MRVGHGKFHGMSSGNLSLSEKYRPRRFSDFIGKPEAVSYLKQQIESGSGRSILFHGPSGCGKSSLAEVYAAGLLCTAVSGQPCLACQSCLAFQEGRHFNLRVFDYGRVSDEEFADQINADVRVETMGNGRFIVLITRANLLSPKAFELLYGQMKRSFVRVTFILCADDINSVPQKSASLFYPLEVRPPDLLDALAYVRRLCGAVHHRSDDEGAEALADLSRSSYQRLALDLEILLAQEKFSARGVVEHFLTGDVVRYVDQVFDRAPFADQLSTLEGWKLGVDGKIERVGRYLSDIFDVSHGLRPGSLRWLERFAGLSDGIVKHAELLRVQPRVFTTRMLQVWAPEVLPGPTTLRRKASEFDDLFAGVTVDVTMPDLVTSRWRANARRTRELRQTEAREKEKIEVSAPLAAEETSLTLDEARKLWDGASFMVQVFGVLLNSYIEIRHGSFDLSRTKSPEQIVTDFLHELRMYVKRSKVEPSAEFHALYAHQTEEDGQLLTRIVAHIPSCKRHPEVWIAGFVRRHAASQVDQAVRIDFGAEKVSFGRHLELIQTLCSGLMPLGPKQQVFLRRTKINVSKVRWRPDKKITAQRVGLSRLIDRQQQAKASQDLEVLSALDSAEADPCSGWELRQYSYRQQIVEQRGMLEQAALGRGDGGATLAEVRRQWKRAKPLREAARPGFS